MSLNYLVSDSLIRIQNGFIAKMFSVEVFHSKYIEYILNILYAEGFILGYKIKQKKIVKKTVEIILKYDKYGNPLIKNIKIISTPGLRKYISIIELLKIKKQKPHLNRLLILSTSRGVLSDGQAILENTGGELICQIN